MFQMYRKTRVPLGKRKVNDFRFTAAILEVGSEVLADCGKVNFPIRMINMAAIDEIRYFIEPRCTVSESSNQLGKDAKMSAINYVRFAAAIL